MKITKIATGKFFKWLWNEKCFEKFKLILKFRRKCEINGVKADFCQRSEFKAGLWQRDLGIVYAYSDYCEPEIVKEKTLKMVTLKMKFINNLSILIYEELY